MTRPQGDSLWIRTGTAGSPAPGEASQVSITRWSGARELGWRYSVGLVLRR